MRLDPLQRVLAGACCLTATAAALMTPAVVRHSHASTTRPASSPTSSTASPAAGTPSATTSRTAPRTSTAGTPSTSATSTPGASSAQRQGITEALQGATRAATTGSTASTSPTASSPVTGSGTLQQGVPTPVTSLRLASNDAASFVVAWDPAQFASSYRVMVNGSPVEQTSGTSATLAFGSGTAGVLVQVAGVSARGLVGEWRALVVVPPVIGAASDAATSAAATSPSTASSAAPPSATATSSSRSHSVHGIQINLSPRTTVSGFVTASASATSTATPSGA